MAGPATSCRIRRAGWEAKGGLQNALKFPNHSPLTIGQIASSGKTHMKKITPLLTSILSLVVCSLTFAAPPSPPQNVQQAWLGLEALLLWDETPSADSYKIYRSDNTNTTWTLVGSSVVPRFRDATFEFLPSFYIVTAVNADGESAGSELSTVAF